MSTSIDAKLAAIDNILATPAGTPNVTLGLLNQAKNIADKNYDTGKIDTPFGNLFARDAVFLFDELNRMGVSDPSKLSAQVVGDKVVYKDGTTGNVVQESKVSEGGSLKLGKTGGRTGDVEGYDLFMVPNEQGGLTLASDKVEQSNWLKFRDNVLKPAAIVGGAYLAATTLPGLLGGGGAGATATGAGALGAEAALTGTGLLGASEAAFVAADAAQLAAQGLNASQITSTLAATGIPTTTASTLAQAATAAFGEAIASGVPANIAAMSAEVAAGTQCMEIFYCHDSAGGCRKTLCYTGIRQNIRTIVPSRSSWV